MNNKFSIKNTDINFCFNIFKFLNFKLYMFCSLGLDSDFPLLEHMQNTWVDL